IAACIFDAIKLDDNGMRIIDKDKCTGCGACVIACPRNLIELVSVKKRVHILCSSHDKGVEAKKRCEKSSSQGKSRSCHEKNRRTKKNRRK
ncbi:MAG: hypothetical protein B1H06_05390, partial [Candidatus Cloacimonas sp. 4484_143]